MIHEGDVHSLIVVEHSDFGSKGGGFARNRPVNNKPGGHGGFQPGHVTQITINTGRHGAAHRRGGLGFKLPVGQLNCQKTGYQQGMPRCQHEPNIAARR